MVFEKIRKILCEQFELEEDRVTMESNLIGDLGADSLDVIDLAMSIEDEFDIEVPDDEIEKIKTVGDIVRFVEHIKSCPSCKEELSIQYLSSEGISHLETGTSFNLEKELTGYMDRALKCRQRKLQRRAALVIYETLALLIITVIFLYTGG